MELIHYADGSIMTGSAIAQALLDYAQVLASRGSAATVQVPTRMDDGTLGSATFLLGPASQIVAVTTTSPFDEVEDAALVERLETETARQRGAAVRPEEQQEFDVQEGDLETGDFVPTDPPRTT
ncbi:hypothetical protein AS850_15750 [Frondihabitans sp. 762G35]|uniref:hypothetical protein n=1 Tax=Frondihabitans sp. 762G35 TaxID=1446794 RepID=UPI000D21963D|nr:hypothetical protein [Frondihabitans sp. 762G35]ARC58542.1 hypothetical protein AS850_15750 [Frondihabitans sp. 762G35]